MFKTFRKYRESLNDYKKVIQFNSKNTKNLKKLASIYIGNGISLKFKCLFKNCYFRT